MSRSRSVFAPLLACLVLAAIVHAETNSTTVYKKDQPYEYFEGDGSECVIVNIKNTGSSSSKQKHTVTYAGGGAPSSKIVKGGQGKTYTSKITSITVEETEVASSTVEWTTTPANPGG